MAVMIIMTITIIIAIMIHSAWRSTGHCHVIKGTLLASINPLSSKKLPWRLMHSLKVTRRPKMTEPTTVAKFQSFSTERTFRRWRRKKNYTW
uniref:Secreted peptide n=1 Tax=Rhipicephalus pulchellus TaxID=72859 RepID=L7LV42_RHIPC